ncbi:RNA-directed DNA polymerase, eukaryota, reverse transcriptase zinc-binding domain protein [Tanacetum coccineum]
MGSWENVLASLNQGGWGIGSLKAFNLALLQKWRWSFTANPDVLWVKLIKAIHGIEAGFDGKGCATTGIWSSIVGSTNYLHSDNLSPKDTLKCHPGNGASIRFWKDLWPITSGRTESKLHSLQSELVVVTLSSSHDSWKWHIENDGSFPVNIFLWRFNLDRLPHRLNLSKHGIDIGFILCPICNNNMEPAEHIFFACEMAAQIWHMIRIWCNIDLATPSYCDWRQWLDSVTGSHIKKKHLFVIIVTMFWIVWKYRNDPTFNSHHLRKSDIYDHIRLCSFTWLKFRGRLVSNWNELLCNPL